MRPNITSKTLSLFLSLSLVAGSSAWARLPSDSDGHQESRRQIIANRAVLLEAGKPICTVDLERYRELTPRFVNTDERPNRDTDSGDNPLYQFPFCDNEQMRQVELASAAVLNGNKTAGLPLAAAAVCLGIVGASAYFSNFTLKRRIGNGPFVFSLTATAASAEAATVLATNALPLPQTYAAFYGGLIGAGCYFVGTALGIGYFHSQR